MGKCHASSSLAECTGASRPPILVHAGQPFWWMPATHSGPSRPSCPTRRGGRRARLGAKIDAG
ncbi:MAG TPA: hypothetical protein DEH11_01490 [Actinobacteria bacterium]|nr:hypothetical protein [Actinomycetota bacterium]